MNIIRFRQISRNTIISSPCVEFKRSPLDSSNNTVDSVIEALMYTQSARDMASFGTDVWTVEPDRKATAKALAATTVERFATDHHGPNRVEA
jgi:hypothetical protein